MKISENTNPNAIERQADDGLLLLYAGLPEWQRWEIYEYFKRKFRCERLSESEYEKRVHFVVEALEL